MIKYLYILVLIGFSSSVAQEENHEVITGIHLEKLQTPFFYETFIPILHEINLPNWDKTDLRIDWATATMNTNCENSDQWAYTWAQQSCPISHHFFKIIDGFLTNITSWNELKSNNEPRTPIPFSCEKIANHFTKTSYGKDEINQYTEDLQRCPHGLPLNTVLLENFADINRTVYATLHAKSFSEYAGGRIFNSYNNIGYAVQTNFYTSLQTMELLNYYLVSNRWTNAISQCEAHKIPYAFVPPREWNVTLSEIQLKLHNKKNEFELTIPSLLTYYKLPLSDCTFIGGTYSMLIRTLVPIRRTGVRYELVNLHSIPFVKASDRNSPTTSICSIENIEGKYIIDKESGLVLKSECETSELCLVPDKASMPIVDPCLSAIFSSGANNVNDNIAKLCKMNCVEVVTERLPIFKRVASDTYIISGKPKGTLHIFINCEDKPYKVISPNETGALQIRLSCTCKIVYQKEELHALSPCGDKLEIKHVTPYFWTSKANMDKYSEKKKEVIVQSSAAPVVDFVNHIDSHRLSEEEYVSSSTNNNVLNPSDISWLTLQIFILWGAVGLLGIFVVVLLGKVFHLSYRSRRDLVSHSRERSGCDSNIYDLPIMLNQQ